MKKLILIAQLIIITSCAREEYVNSLDLNTTISFKSITPGETGEYNGNTLIDSVKTSISNNYQKKIHLESPSTIKQINIYKGSTIIQTYNTQSNIYDYNLSWLVDSSGQQNYVIEIVTITNKTKKIICQIFSFINLPPVAQFVYDQTNKRLDFTSSYDLDARWGGTIVNYSIYVNGNLKKNDADVYYYTNAQSGFTSQANYNIKLVVQDNNKATASLEKIITI